MFVHHTIRSTFVTMGSFTTPHLPGFLLAFAWVETSIENSLLVKTKNCEFIDRIRSPSNRKGACHFTCAQYRRRNSKCHMYFKYSSFHIWLFMTKQGNINFSILNHINGQRAIAARVHNVIMYS